MFDIGFWELLVIAVVLLLVMGPERLPEVARQAAFLVRKVRQSMFRLRSEMQSEIDGTQFSELRKARQEMADFKNDIKQFGRDFIDSAQETIDLGRQESAVDPLDSVEASAEVEHAATGKSADTKSKKKTKTSTVKKKAGRKPSAKSV